MTTRDRAPLGSPCWADLLTSDPEASRAFYTGLFGWEAQEPSEEFGGYFMFTRGGIPIAGAMPSAGTADPTEASGPDSWSVYLDTDDMARTVGAATAAGATVVAGPMPVADLGTMAVLVDPTGASVGAWEAGTFPGFLVLDEPGAPSWFELFTRGHADAVAFYESVFGWETDVVGDTDEFRYSTMRGPGPDEQLAGVMDASSFLSEDEPSRWSVYWEVEDTDAALARAVGLGGSVVDGATDTPYGRMATVQDPTGSRFKLRRAPG